MPITTDLLHELLDRQHELMNYDFAHEASCEFIVRVKQALKLAPVKEVKWCRMCKETAIASYSLTGICTKCWNTRSAEVTALLEKEGWTREKALAERDAKKK